MRNNSKFKHNCEHHIEKTDGKNLPNEKNDLQYYHPGQYFDLPLLKPNKIAQNETNAISQ